MTENELVALKGGAPLSVTIVVMTLLEPAWDTSGVQVIIPVTASMAGTFAPVTVLEMA